MTDFQQELYGDLWQKLVTETETYPWNPETADSYYEQIETESPLTDYLCSEMSNQRSQDFFSQIEKLYAPNILDRVTQVLVTQFGNLVPMSWLEAIAQRLPDIPIQTALSLDELINCVKPLLCNWCVEDLELFARPIVFDLRCRNLNPPPLPTKNWPELSEIEKARLTVIIAEIALENWKKYRV
ncbi:hypothetical protein [Gloeocapsa sp. PCC 73106]|uniref:hypothetical protein n=1 Tax=Gloeocapsa sp. PCC 73106 TaxID=102232 RepID=UPI0002F972D5|nr:hypothetical protein [Gloeocapsa sp. PCC 73106]